MRTLALLLPLALVACDTNNNQDFEQCELDLELAPSAAAPGATVDAIGRPMSDVLDTVVSIDGVDAEVVDVSLPESCEACETCKTDAECGVCETCEACASECATCAPTARFIVPDLAAGDVGIVVANRYGTSLPLAFEVLASQDE